MLQRRGAHGRTAAIHLNGSVSAVQCTEPCAEEAEALCGNWVLTISKNLPPALSATTKSPGEEASS